MNTIGTLVSEVANESRKDLTIAMAASLTKQAIVKPFQSFAPEQDDLRRR
jgi:hypothetical protein